MYMNDCKTKTRPDFTLVEIMISLAVLALLMAAVAVAFNASAINYAANEDMFKAMSTARQAMMRITSDLRTATAVLDSEPATQCSIVTADGRDITYQFNAGESILYLVVNSGANAGSYALCKNVTAMTFSRTAAVDDASIVKNVRLSLTVTVDDASQSVSSAAVIRSYSVSCF